MLWVWVVTNLRILHHPVLADLGPRVPAGIGEVVELGLRNKFGDPGECYDFLIGVFDPFGDYAAWAQDTVCGDEWTEFTYDDTFVPGLYAVYFGIEGQLIAQDFFEVSEG